jgi:hypothetical protein
MPRNLSGLQARAGLRSICGVREGLRTETHSLDISRPNPLRTNGRVLTSHVCAALQGAAMHQGRTAPMDAPDKASFPSTATAVNKFFSHADGAL